MKILIVEDEPLNRELLKDIITAEGHEFIIAENAKMALQIVTKNRPDLIFMDRRLPDMDGIEVIKILKSSPETKTIPIIVISAYAMNEDKDKADEIGCSGYITKPFRYDDIASAIKKHQL